MESFVSHTGVAAPLRMMNVDTDMIIPKQFLKTIKRTGLGANLFHELRFDSELNENPNFVLNLTPFRQASILIAGENFGCGSSREHAPWALTDFGIKAVIAPSFADIFYGNCFENGILPVTLPKDVVEQMMSEAETGNTRGSAVTIDLESKSVTTATGIIHTFDIHDAPRYQLLNGLDSIGQTLKLASTISEFEGRSGSQSPWL